ncbi:MAG TPA: rhamnogalacturonan acetylesterase [Acidobacteriaceae bacterium]|nr:rhamnogalacturonan acetylesterase [Acidobacteriaceae bacterium]
MKLLRFLLTTPIFWVTIAAGQATSTTIPAYHRAFVFGQSAHASDAITAVTSPAPYSAGWGFGFEGDPPSVEASSIGGKPFFFSFDAPEGNYRLTVTLGADEPSDTTVKAELRRLMIEAAAAPAGGSVTKTFIVNVRTPALPTGGVVRLKAPRESEQEARDWDSRITLEFDGTNPGIRRLTVDRVDVPTIYLLGDSTVCDQMGEPYASWGQMLPRFFKATIAVANHAESGETVAASNSRGRFAKILSLIQPGDVFIVQFGHNDMKEKAKDPDAASKYKAGLIAWANAIKAKGATPVIVTPMNRHTFQDGHVVNSLEEYPQMAREAAAETGSALIDLNAQSKILYEAFGEKGSLHLFEHNADYTQMDGTHHSPFGAYELAKLIVQGLIDDKLPVAQQIVDDWTPFNPAHPDAEADFHVPPSITFATAKPFGN